MVPWITLITRGEWSWRWGILGLGTGDWGYQARVDIIHSIFSALHARSSLLSAQSFKVALLGLNNSLT